MSLIIIGGGLVWFLQSGIIVKNNGQGSLALQDQVDPAQLKGEGDGRVNLLLIGVDEGKSLSDSIILLSLDPIAKDVAMVSIPRDMYVEIPGYGSAKINAAHSYGENYDYEGGGPALLSETLSQTLDAPIHYYVRLDFEAFDQAIDTVGGVNVDVEETIEDFSYPDEVNGGHIHFYLEAGPQELDAETALKYARSRYSTSDFDRSRRQQKLLLAFKDKVLSLGTLTNPAKINSLMHNFSGNVETNLKLEEIIRLVDISKGINEDRVVQAQIDTSEDSFLSFSNLYGQSVLVPTAGDYSEIQEYVRGILVDGYIKDEAARVSVLNGTTVPGVATNTGQLLRSYGYKVDNVDNASDQNYTRTVIFDYGGDKPYTVRYLEQRFGVIAQRRSRPEHAQDFDIEIVIGSDYVEANY